MIKLRLLLLVCYFTWSFSGYAQLFTGIDTIHPIIADGNKSAISGFFPFEDIADEIIYTNSLLWVIENVCPQLREGVSDVNIPAKSFKCEGSFLPAGLGSKQNTIYYWQASLRVADGKLIYYLSDIFVETSVLGMKKVTPLEKLQSGKKTTNQQTVDDFVKIASEMLNRLFDFIAVNQPGPVIHWQNIHTRKPVEGMSKEECRLAFGKPQSILETNGEVQWMYSSSFYLFFKDGYVKTIIK